MQKSSPDHYVTLRSAARVEPPKTKGSRFLGDAFPVGSEEDAAAQLAAVRKREYAATHHVWAFRLAPDGDLFRYSDDGEPSGSGGLPIFKEIESRSLMGVLVVVTRYYGGTKLGTGGLARAYAGAAAAVLDRAARTTVVLRSAVRLQFGFDDTSPAMHTVGQFDAKITGTDYSADGTTMHIAIRQSEVEPFLARFTEALGGRGAAGVEL